MAELQRKIELQEPDDLRYLLANTRRVAGEKIDVALPPIEGEDVLRQKVEELVNSVGSPFLFPFLFFRSSSS
jgi:kinetochor protein Mis14/NSL1